jgi:hypothetical protein
MRFADLRPVTGIVRAGIYIAFAASIVALLYLAGSFVYALTHTDDLGAKIATNVYRMPALEEGIAESIHESRTGAVRFRLNEVYGVFTWLNMPREIVFAVYFHLFILWLLFFAGVRELANVFEDVGAGNPFALENARRLRIVGLCMAGGGLFKILYTVASFAVFYDDVIIPGARIPYRLLVAQDFSLGLVFGGLVVLAVSEVFRIGNRLQEDQNLTV